MSQRSDRNGMTSTSVIAVVASVIAIMGWWISGLSLSNPNTTSPTKLTDVAKRANPEPHSNQDATKHAVKIRPGPSTPQVTLQATGPGGAHEVSAKCSSCHSTRPADISNKQPSDLDEFHQGLAFSHNSLSCLSCHNPQDYNTLRLADGTPVAYENVMKLCAQCHGPQTRDYEHGAHGGMTGYWDLSRGPRQRNNCVDCHHPHTPEFPKMKPTFKPRDRFLNDVPSHDTPAEGATSHE